MERICRNKANQIFYCTESVLYDIWLVQLQGSDPQTRFQQIKSTQSVHVEIRNELGVQQIKKKERKKPLWCTLVWCDLWKGRVTFLFFFNEVLLDSSSSHFLQSSHMFSPRLLTASPRHCETRQGINHASANIIIEANSGKRNVSRKPASLECHFPFGVNKPIIKSGP